ncbi:MAG: hemerythrin domain-containing protein [Deltaproteobacteria bacterium]|nr:hemerythrin domain-containing protein [Deltaproteobacteria bacterium]
MAMEDRRSFLVATGAAIVGVGISADAAPRGRAAVTPIEALVCDHGILRRVMYLYDEAARRMEGNEDVAMDVVGACAATIRRVIEDVHERLEEELVFPRLERTHGELVGVLRRQHGVGRGLTDQVLALMKGASADHLVFSLRAFTRMYRPHADREDTVVFPAVRDAVGPAGYRELGEQLGERTRQLLGSRDEDRALEDVARLERALGVDDLAKLMV